MSFSFDGLFSTAGVEVLGELLRAFPGARGRRVTAPFEGIALKFTAAAASPAAPLAGAAPDYLAPLARRFPDAVFVWIRTEAVDGKTRYRGLGLRGETILCYRDPENSAFAKPMPLQIASRSITGKPVAPAVEPPADFPHDLAALVAPLGVKLRTGYFAPFSLRFWDGV